MFEQELFISLPIKSADLDIKEESIYKLLGYSQKAEEEFISDTIQKCIQKSRQLIMPIGGYIIKKIEALDLKTGILTLPDNIDLHINRIIAAQLKEAAWLALFIGTIGNKVEKLSESLFQEGDPLEGYLMNLTGSEAAESVAHIVHEKIYESVLQHGLSVTNRFSPGYCDWNVAEQFKMFNFFPYEKCEVTLTESALMNPVKSVSGIIGIGEHITRKAYPCNKCSKENCIYKNSQ